MNEETESRPATRFDTDSPYPREGLELVVPEEEPRPVNVAAPLTTAELLAVRHRVDETWRRDVFQPIGRIGHPNFAHDCYDCAARDRAQLLASLDASPAPRRLPGWLARLVGR